MNESGQSWVADSISGFNLETRGSGKWVGRGLTLETTVSESESLGTSHGWSCLAKMMLDVQLSLHYIGACGEVQRYSNQVGMDINNVVEMIAGTFKTMYELYSEILTIYVSHVFSTIETLPMLHYESSSSQTSSFRKMRIQHGPPNDSDLGWSKSIMCITNCKS